jgi:hypothetical protein
VTIGVFSRSTHRTFASARAVKQWLSKSGTSIREVDIFTVGVHARKSWILFRRALGEDYRVGIIAGTESSYDAASWMISKRGVYIVVRNLAGYLYSELWLAFGGGMDADTLESVPVSG